MGWNCTLNRPCLLPWWERAWETTGECTMKYLKTVLLGLIPLLFTLFTIIPMATMMVACDDDDDETSNTDGNANGDNGDDAKPAGGASGTDLCPAGASKCFEIRSEGLSAIQLATRINEENSNARMRTVNQGGTEYIATPEGTVHHVFVANITVKPGETVTYSEALNLVKTMGGNPITNPEVIAYVLEQYAKAELALPGQQQAWTAFYSYSPSGDGSVGFIFQENGLAILETRKFRNGDPLVWLGEDAEKELSIGVLGVVDP